MTANGVARRLAEWTIHSGLLIGLGATSMTALSLALHGRPTSVPGCGWLIGSATAALYALHRLMGLYLHRQEPLSGRMALIQQHRTGIMISLVAWSVLCLGLLFMQFDFLYVAWMAPGAVLGLAYVIPFSKKGTRLRDVNWWKIVWVGLAWSWLTAFVPSYFLADLALGNSLIQATERFCFIVAITLPFEIRDRQTDSREGLRNLAALLTERQTIRLGKGLMILVMASAGWNGFHFLNLPYALVPVLLFFPYMALLRLAFRTPDDLYISGLTDGLMILALLLYAGLGLVW